MTTASAWSKGRSQVREGDMIVVTGAFRLSEGQEVRLMHRAGTGIAHRDVKP